MTTTTRPTGRRARWATLTVATVVLGVGVLIGATHVDANLLPEGSPVIGTTAPDDPLPLLDGTGTVRLSDLRGHVVVVNFWASWCAPCRQEHAALIETASAYADQGVRFVGVAYQDGVPVAQRFLDELGAGGQEYLYVTDPDSRAAIDFGVFGIPETYLVDADGTITRKLVGEMTTESLSRSIDQTLALGRAS